MTDADVQRVIAGPDAESNAAETALLRAVDDLYRDDVVSDATWNALSATLDAKQLLDVLITIGGYRMVSMALNTFGVQLDPAPSGSSRRCHAELIATAMKILHGMLLQLLAETATSDDDR